MKSQTRTRRSQTYNPRVTPAPNVPRSQFDLSHTHQTTFDAGFLVPILVEQDILPGDTIDLTTELFGRVTTLLKPIMSQLYLEVHAFFIPHRLVWDNWQKFMGEQDDPDDSIDFTIPISTSPASVGYLQDTIHDYMDIPPGVPDLEHSALPLRCYNLVWSEWFRDENIQDGAPRSTGNGPDDVTDFTLLRRNKKHDYFTSCLPWPQKGDAVTIPLGTSAPLVGTLNIDSTGSPPTFAFDSGETPTQTAINIIKEGISSDEVVYDSTWNPTGPQDLEWDDPNLEVDLSAGTVDLTAATAATVNVWRQAMAFQELLERDARGGTRYTELLRSHFGVTSEDQRLQRPEFLGSASTPMFVNIVPNTFGSAGDLGTLAAFGLFSQSGRNIRRTFTEHGTVLVLASVCADQIYQYGLHKSWSRQTREEFYFPALAHLGEQAVLNKELWAEGIAADDLAFGYQGRWDEYRMKTHRVSGSMRSSHSASLDVWHLGQEYSALPVLESDYIQEDTPVDRVVGVPAEHHFNVQANFGFKIARVMPTMSIPGLGGRL